MTASSNRPADYGVRELDFEYGRHGDLPMLARVYQPEEGGPYPVLLSVHGGAWTMGDRTTDAMINRPLAATGLTVVAPDFREAPEYPYPAQIVDVNLATRWVKRHAAEFNGDARVLGGMGLSSGAHTLLLSAMRPHDARYSALPLPEAPDADATLDYFIGLWPMLDPYARYLFTQTTPSAGEGFGGQARKVEQTLGYFLTEEAMHEGNPQEVLEREEMEALPPMLIVQGTADMNIPLTLPQRFAPAYRAAGGSVTVEWFPGMPHKFAATPGPETDRALQLVRGFVAEQLATAEPVL